MSIVISETSPRALLDSALLLSCSLNLLGDDDSGGPSSHSTASRGPGFILKEVETVLLQIRTDLDVQPADSGDSEPPPLMMRLRDHINSISSVLTGNQIDFASSDTTTLHELIECLSLLNRSVTTTQKAYMGCIIH